MLKVKHKKLNCCLVHRKPTKAALAAVSEHLAGVLPLHLVYSQAHEAAIEVITYLPLFNS